MGDLTGLTTVGAHSFLHELLTIAGGASVFADAIGLYPQVAKESLVVRAPEVIIEACPGIPAEAQAEALRADWERIPGIPAVRDRRVYCLTNDFLLIPGPRVGDTARAFAEAIHPEVFH